MSEEELKNKIELLDREIDSNIAEKYKLQEKYYELYELPKLKKKYLNKYFIYKNNSYSKRNHGKRIYSRNIKDNRHITRQV